MKIGRKGDQSQQQLYQMYTACPSCDWSPQGLVDDHAELLRIGISKNFNGRRADYEQNHEFFRHVQMITVEHFVGRDDVKTEETRRLGSLTPMFNMQENKLYKQQKRDRARVLGHPVPKSEAASEVVFHVKRWLHRAAVGVSCALAGSAGTLVALWVT